MLDPQKGNTMNTFCMKSFKRNMIAELLSGCDTRRNEYSLIIHSCYFDFEASKKLIESIRQIKNNFISEVHLFIDSKEARKKYSELVQFNSFFRGINVFVNIVNAGEKLFHSKAYCVFKKNENNDFVSGSLIIGSGNLTGNGVASQNGNIESFLGTTSVVEIEEFYKQTMKLSYTAIENISEVTLSRKEFREAVVTSGSFIYFWKEDLGKYLSIKYELTEDARNNIISQSPLNDLGFNIETATVSKRYLTPPEKSIDISGWKKYCIETHLGFWMPKAVLHELSGVDNDEFEKYKAETIKYLKSEHTKEYNRIKNDYLKLIELNLIEKLSDSPEELIKTKILELEQNDVKLKRIYYGYFDFDIPYDISSENYYENIKEIYEEMEDTIGSRKSLNNTMKAFRKAAKSKSIESLLNGEEIMKSGV